MMLAPSPDMPQPPANEPAPLGRVIVGAGLGGLARALHVLRTEPERPLRLVDAASQPGGTARTSRAEGYVCELGPIGFPPEQFAALVRDLPAPPAMLSAKDAATRGWCFDGKELHPLAVPLAPVSCRHGVESIVQAMRLALDGRLLLGRAITAVLPHDTGFALALAGEVPITLTAEQVDLCLPPAASARLLAPLDPALAAAAARLQQEPRAFAFFGFDELAVLPLSLGYGVLPAMDLPTQIAEVICCTNVFAHRALPGRALLRVELALAAPVEDDAALLGTALRELRAWTGLQAPLRFQRLHRFAIDRHDATLVECRIRLQGLMARAAGLWIADT